MFNIMKPESIVIETPDRGNALIDKVDAVIQIIENQDIGYYTYSDAESAYDTDGLNRYVWVYYDLDYVEVQKIEVVEDIYADAVYIYFFAENTTDLITVFTQHFTQLTLDDLLKKEVAYFIDKPDRLLLLGISNNKKYDERIEVMLEQTLNHEDPYFRSCAIIAMEYYNGLFLMRRLTPY